MLLIFDRRGSRWGEFRDVAWGESSGETATRAGGEGATREKLKWIRISRKIIMEILDDNAQQVPKRSEHPAT